MHIDEIIKRLEEYKQQWITRISYLQFENVDVWFIEWMVVKNIERDRIDKWATIEFYRLPF